MKTTAILHPHYGRNEPRVGVGGRIWDMPGRRVVCNGDVMTLGVRNRDLGDTHSSIGLDRQG